MKKFVAFLALALGGLALLVWGAGGFFGKGTSGDKPQSNQAVEGAGGGGIPLRDFGAKAGDAPPVRIQETRESKADARLSEPRSWVDGTTKERFEFPHFLAWTMSVQNIEPFRDPATGAQGFRYHKVRILQYRDPQSRAEAEALRADPVKNRLLYLEIDAEDGSGTWDVHGGARPERPVVRLTKSAVLRNHLTGLVVRCDDAVVDLEAETAEGAGEIVAEHPACSLRGRGMRLDRRSARFEILEKAHVRVRSTDTAANPLGDGSIRSSQLRGEGGALITELPPTEGKGYRIVVDRGVQVDQSDDTGLKADSAEFVVIEVPAEEPRKPGEPKSSYHLTWFTAVGNVEIQRRGEAHGAPSLLAVYGDRLDHDATARGPGRTRISGSCRATFRGEFSAAGAAGKAGLVRLSCTKTLALGPAGPDHPEADLVLSLDERAVVERTAAAGEEAPERIEADRIDLFLRGARATAAPVEAGPLASDPSSHVAVGFVAAGNVRIAGPRVSGTAHTIVGTDLDRPEFRLVADGGPHFDVASVAPARGGSTRRGGSPSGSAPSKEPAKAQRLEALRATGDVFATLRGAGSTAIRFESDTLVYDVRTGAILERRGNGGAWVALPGAAGEDDHRVTAPWISFRPNDGLLTTKGGTVAVVGLGSRGAATSGDGKPDHVSVRGGGRIVVEGRKAPGVDYRISIDGGGSIETVGEQGVFDQLRAKTIEADVGTGPATADSAIFGAMPGVARAPSPAPETPRAAPATATTASTRWTIECRDLSVALGATPSGSRDLRSFDATGGVVARTDEHRIEGSRLLLDGSTGQVRIFGSGADLARLRSGQGDATQRAWARNIDVTLVDGKPSRALLYAPATVVLLRPSGKTPQTSVLERLELRTESHLEITSKGAETRGRTALTRAERKKPGEAFGKPVSLWTSHLVVEADHLLGGGKSELRRMVARGPGTRFESGDPNADGLSAVGDSIAYDARARVVRIDDSRRVTLVQKGGTIEAKWVTFDLATGLPDFEGSRMVLGGGVK